MSNEALKSFDYVIVGGGTSGLVVAARLSENPEINVCVLEAGDNHLDDPQISIPALWPGLMGSDLDWQYWAVPQDGFAGRSVKLPSGKLLGGSSGLNGQAFIAPSKSGINAWGKMGYPKWSWDVLKPYYKRFYTLHLPDEPIRAHLGIDWVDTESMGDSGPIQAAFAGVVEDPVGKAWVDTFKALDSATNHDPFSGESLGGYANAYTCDPATRTRSYSASAYYAPTASRPNLTLITGANVAKLLFEAGSSPAKAVGVHYSHDGSEKVVRAKKEIILAAGAIQSPKILELSGVGDRQRLSKLGISTVVDNPNVGENLQDHVMTAFCMEAVDSVPTGDALMRQEPEAIQGAMDMYAKHKAGPLAAGGVASHAFMPTPDLAGEIGSVTQKRLFDETLNPVNPSKKDCLFHKVVRQVLESPEESSAALFLFAVQIDCHSVTSKFVDPTALKPGSFITLGANQCHPFSRGNTHISSDDPLAKPHVDPKYLSHPLDIEILARHFQYLERLAETKPLANFIKQGGMRNHPTAYVRELEAAKRYLREAGMSNWHVCGSCGMMPMENGGVVDGDMVVHGTKNVRVVDASVFPLIPRGNIMSTVYATAERAADIIRGIS